MEERVITWEDTCVSTDFTLEEKIILLNYLLTNR